MPQRIHNRWLLVALLAGAQLGCLLIGEAWLLHRLRVELTSELQGQATQSAAIVARAEPPLPVLDERAALDEHALRAAERIVAAAHRGGLGVTAAVVFLGTLLAAIIVRRYEDRLAEANRRLESVADRRGQELLRTRDAVIFGLAKLAESRDDDTGEHLDRIRRYVELLARELSRTMPELDERQIATLGLTSSLHDIGKVGVPDAVLLKAGALNPDERAVIQKHPLIGGDCLMAIRERLPDDHFLDAACEIAFAHHERWDGRGYPFGLRGEEIPLSARIVALADVYDALTTRRVYKPAMPHERAREIILHASGTQFDPRIVQAFLACEDQFRAISQRERAAAVAPSRESELVPEALAV